MKVFISSVIEGYKPYRDAAEKAVRTAGSEPIMSERFGARPYSSAYACLSEIEQADVYVLILGERYGFEPEPGVSVTQQEFRHAVSLGKPILVFVDQVDMEPPQARFRVEVEDFKAGFHRVGVSSPEEFKDELIAALIRLGQARAACSASDFEARVKSASARDRHFGGHGDAAKLTVAFLPQPARSVDITRIETRLDAIFDLTRNSGLTSARDGYEPISEHEATGLKSGHTTLRYFDDGLLIAEFAPKTAGDRDYGFAGYYLPPSVAQRLVVGCFPLFEGASGWCQVTLSGMENRVMQEVPPGQIRSFSMPHRQENEQSIRKLMIPCNQAAYSAWVDEVIRRLARTFGRVD
ncbi:MAG: hypothetical protein JWQ90_284 [Hydrocarboniphaga sp.]|uniref:DUF4062 domain-containing protein n=1 Tax=Hydrocarboniphaga sp. TaxID=2033016 RepID=UPI002605771F|nr:DUF4062 domain-containing protein [Hydrocarboniphaga sp.]MDB5967834.1 hypothetical protein [Hydrocarboniphaga sp.]